MKTQFSKNLLGFVLATFFAQILFAQAVKMEGVYLIVSNGTGKRVDGNFEQIYPSAPNGGAYQMWRINPMGLDITHKDGPHWVHRIISIGTGKCLDGNDTALYPHDLVAESQNQNWTIDKTPVAGCFTITNRQTGKRLDGDANRLYPFDANGGKFQQWKLIKVNDSDLAMPNGQNPFKIFGNCDWVGDQKLLKSGLHPTVPVGFNDEISSFQLFEGWHVCAFEHDNFQGRSEATSDAKAGKCLANRNNGQAMNFDGVPSPWDFNDQISSLMIFKSDHLVFFQQCGFTTIATPEQSYRAVNTAKIPFALSPLTIGGVYFTGRPQNFQFFREQNFKGESYTTSLKGNPNGVFCLSEDAGLMDFLSKGGVNSFKLVPIPEK